MTQLLLLTNGALISQSNATQASAATLEYPTRGLSFREETWTEARTRTTKEYLRRFHRLQACFLAFLPLCPQICPRPAHKLGLPFHHSLVSTEDVGLELH